MFEQQHSLLKTAVFLIKIMGGLPLRVDTFRRRFQSVNSMFFIISVNGKQPTGAFGKGKKLG